MRVRVRVHACLPSGSYSQETGRLQEEGGNLFTSTGRDLKEFLRVVQTVASLF